jgi:hypothetical protein
MGVSCIHFEYMKVIVLSHKFKEIDGFGNLGEALENQIASLHTGGVAGSIPASPTIEKCNYRDLGYEGARLTLGDGGGHKLGKAHLVGRRHAQRHPGACSSRVNRYDPEIHRSV